MLRPLFLIRLNKTMRQLQVYWVQPKDMVAFSEEDSLHPIHQTLMVLDSTWMRRAARSCGSLSGAGQDSLIQLCR